MYSGSPGVGGETGGVCVGVPQARGPASHPSPLQSRQALRKGFVTLVCLRQLMMTHRGALYPPGMRLCLLR